MWIQCLVLNFIFLPILSKKRSLIVDLLKIKNIISIHIMIKTYITIIALFISINAFAQIPNPSFEQWQGASPASWVLTNNDALNGVFPATQTSISHHGTKALKLGVDTLVNSTVPGRAVCTNFIETTQPASIHYWAKSNFLDNDAFYMTARILDDSLNQFGYAVNDININTNVFTEYIVDFTYSKVDTASFAEIVFNLWNDGGMNSNLNSQIIIDELAWGSTASIKEINSKVALAFEFESLTPNPSNEASALIYNLSNPGLTNIALYDIYGKKVKDILNSEQQGIGRFKTYFDTYDLAEGVYLCQLNVNGTTLSKKLVVTKE